MYIKLNAKEHNRTEYENKIDLSYGFSKVADGANLVSLFSTFYNFAPS